MNDFYAVLTQSIIDRGLRSARDREATYSQARTAMIRRLWSYDPPLAEDEIDARIGQFDLAVDEIESNVVEVFERLPETVDREDPPEESREEPPALPVVDGYDQEADYAPAFGGSSRERSSDDDALTDGETDQDDDGYDEDEGYDEDGNQEEDEGFVAAQAPQRNSLTELLSTLDIRSLAVEAALNSDPDEPPAARETAELPDEEIEEEIEDDDQEEDRPRYYLPVPVRQTRDVSDYRYAREEEAVLVEPAPREESRPDRRPRAPAARTRTRPAPAIEQPGRGRTTKRPARRDSARQRPPAPKRAPATQRIRLLIAAVGALAVALVALTAYILMPGSTALTPGTDAPSVAAIAPPPPTVSTSKIGQTSRLPPTVDGSLRRFVLFDGSDPTVFETDPSNPVRFDGSIARVSTSTGSAGATALIGPGLAVRLAGHTVRVALMVRSAKENGSANIRVAIQSGLAVSYWKTANLTADFAPIDLTWRIPTLRTDPTGDAIIIEPGIPGDGTGAEIGAIAIDLLD